MNKYFQIIPISDPPKEDGPYTVCRLHNGFPIGHSFNHYANGKWDLPSGYATHYLAPLAEPVEGMRWTKITDKNSLPPSNIEVLIVKWRDWRVYEVEMGPWIAARISREHLEDHCQGTAEYYWLNEPSTPSAREAELEREIERLKGLIQPAFIAGLSVDEDDPVGDSWHAFRKQHNLC